MKKVLLSLASCFFLAINLIAFANQPAPILILSAVQVEQKPVLSYLTRVKSSIIKPGFKVYTGFIGKQPIVSARTGVGAVYAAMSATALIIHFHPRLVIFSGTAGGMQANVMPGDVVMPSQVFAVDFGQYKNGKMSMFFVLKSPIQGHQAQLMHQIDAPLIARIKANQKSFSMPLHFGALATDQTKPTSSTIFKQLTKHHVAAISMEDTAVATVCTSFDIPYLSVRGVSDNILLKQPFTLKSNKLGSRAAALASYQLVKLLSDVKD